MTTLGGQGTTNTFGAVTALAISHDGTRLMAGFDQGQIVRWDLETGKVLNCISDIHRTRKLCRGLLWFSDIMFHTNPLTAIVGVLFTDDRKLTISHDAAVS